MGGIPERSAEPYYERRSLCSAIANGDKGSGVVVGDGEETISGKILIKRRLGPAFHFFFREVHSPL